MVVCDGTTHGGSTPTKWDRSGSHPSAHTAPRPLVRQIREFVKAVHQASRAGRHARGELGVGMGALHLSFQGCHQPWGQAELAAGCGRYAVLNSARTTTTENGLTGKSGYPSFDGVSTTLWAPSDHWGCFLLSFEGCTKCLKNDREQWRPLQNLHRSVTLEKRIFCCRIQNGKFQTNVLGMFL